MDMLHVHVCVPLCYSVCVQGSGMLCTGYVMTRGHWYMYVMYRVCYDICVWCHVCQPSIIVQCLLSSWDTYMYMYM